MFFLSLIMFNFLYMLILVELSILALLLFLMSKELVLMLPMMSLLLLCWVLELLVVFILVLVLWMFLVLQFLSMKRRLWKNVYVYCFFYRWKEYFSFTNLFLSRGCVNFIWFWIGMSDFVSILFLNWRFCFWVGMNEFGSNYSWDSFHALFKICWGFGCGMSWIQVLEIVFFLN